MRVRLPNTARPFVATTAVALTIVLSACGSGGGSGGGAGDGTLVPPPDENPTDGEGMMPVVGTPPVERPPDDAPSCSTLDQNEWVYGNMLDYYLFYDQVPVVEPGTFDSPEALLSAVRFEERDPFSYIEPAGEADLEVEEGREFGLGYNWGEDADGAVRITRVITDSPFGRAGIERGDVVTEIDGRPALEALWDDDFYERVVFGTPEAPGSAAWAFLDRDSGEPATEVIRAAEYAIDTVRHLDWFTNESYDGVVGYFLFERFLETSERELDEAFAVFRERNVTDLVLDLRYNRGGRVSVAQQLASLIVDERQAGAELQRYRYNDKYAAAENYELLVRDDIAGLGLRRLVVLVTSATASSSEIVISGLEPLMDVSVVGSFYTSGKPYIQRGRDRCDQRLNAVEAEALNSVGESVFGGIRPDCYAYDDWRQGFGMNAATDEIESMLLAGLDLAVFGTCEPFVDARAGRRIERGESPSGQGAVASGGAIF